MFQRVYVGTVLVIVLSFAFWLGFNYVVAGGGAPFGAGVCTGIGLAFAVMFFGGLWAEGARKRDERRRALTPLNRIE